MKLCMELEPRWLIIAVLCGLATVGRAQTPTTTPAQLPPPPQSDESNAAAEDATDPSSAQLASLTPPTNPQEKLAWLNAQLTAAANTRGPMQLAALVWRDGQPLWQLDPAKPMNLASNSKLLTAVAALRIHGPGARFATRIAVDAKDANLRNVGSIYLVGSGDPSLTQARLEQLALDAAARGLRKATRLVLDDSAFDAVALPPKYDTQPGEGAAFRAETGALAVEQSALTISITPRAAGQLATVRLTPETGKLITLTNNVQTVAGGANSIAASVTDAGDVWRVTVTGKVVANSGVAYVRRRAPNARKLTAAVTRLVFAKAGIKLGTRAVQYRAAPPGSIDIAKIESATLSDLLRSMNKQSNNFYADMLFKTLPSVGPRSWSAAGAAVAQTLAQCGVVGAYRLDNGSGLFDASAITAQQLAQTLACGALDARYATDFVSSLPISGADGTMARRTPWGGWVRAKTGTLATVSTLAGYIGRKQGTPLIFAILISNVPKGSATAARALQDRMVNAIVAADL